MVVGTFRLSTGRKTAVEEGTCMTLQRDRIRQKLEMEMGLILNRKSECESAVELLDTRTEKDQRLHPLHDAVNLSFLRSFPDGSYSKESAYNAGDEGLIPGSGRSPG